MGDKWIVLKPSAPMNICNSVCSLKQGQAFPAPPAMELDPEIMDIFTDKKKALKAAAKNAERFNDVVSEGVTTRKTLEKNKAKNARSPSDADRNNVRKNAKEIDSEGHLHDPAAEKLKEENEKLKEELEEAENDTEGAEGEADTLAEEKAELEKENAELKKQLEDMKSNKPEQNVNPDALLDQNRDTTVRRIRNANLNPAQAERVLKSEKLGKKRNIIMRLLEKISDKSLKDNINK